MVGCVQRIDTSDVLEGIEDKLEGQAHEPKGEHTMKTVYHLLGRIFYHLQDASFVSRKVRASITRTKCYYENRWLTLWAKGGYR